MHDLIVVGAGLAGLALAARAQEAGQDVAVIEARSRTGGRSLGHRTASGCYDLGPAWIWPAMQPRVARAAAALGLRLYRQADEGGFVFQDSDGTAQRLPHGFAQEPPSMRVEGGIAALTEGFAARLAPGTIRLGTRVERLVLESDAVGVETGAAALRARRVALALPPRLAATIGFAPALPAASLRQFEAVPTWMAGHAKALAIYDAPVWRASGLSGGAFSRCGPLGEIHDASLPGAAGEAALFGFFAWPAAMRAARRARLEDAVRAQLASLFGPAAGSPRALLIQDWSTDELTATPADAPPLAGHPAYAPLALPAPWRDRVLLSGSENAPEFGGYLEGALAAAEAAAAMNAQHGGGLPAAGVAAGR